MNIFPRSKKGVSPLIATVLLIAFAVALGAVVMNWGRGYVEDTTKRAEDTSLSKTTCSMDVGLKLVQIAGVDKACYGGSGANAWVDITLLNNKKEDIEDLQLIVYGTPDIYTNISLLNSTLYAGRAKRLNLSYDNTTYGTIQKIEITPKIRVRGQVIVCADNALEIETINECS